MARGRMIVVPPQFVHSSQNGPQFEQIVQGDNEPFELVLIN